ncbi:hypothetical protein [Comamonas sp.]|uniref:hypothetical protein n=1 Tax=Comamonas sp. TaxID=34028 RepID=UPI002FC7C584
MSINWLKKRAASRSTYQSFSQTMIIVKQPTLLGKHVLITNPYQTKDRNPALKPSFLGQ